MSKLTFTLWVDNFGVKYTNKVDVERLIAILKKWYEISEDWAGTTYCGLTLTWHYSMSKATRWMDLTMPGYIQQCLHKFKHPKPRRPRYSPHPSPLSQFGTATQLLAPTDESSSLGTDKQTRLQQIVGSLLFFARAVDNKILKALNAIARKTGSATELTAKWTTQLLNYMATHPTAKLWYWAIDMILKGHSDASYLNEDNARSSFV